MSLPVLRIRFYGLRKLNWEERSNDQVLAVHLQHSGLLGWLDVGPLTIIVGPNAGGKSTVIDLFRAFSDASIWPSLPRENYPGSDCSGFEAQGLNWHLIAVFSKYTPEASDHFRQMTVMIKSTRGEVTRTESILMPKFLETGPWRAHLQNLLDLTIDSKVSYLAPMGELPAAGLSDAELVSYLNELSGFFPSVLANAQNPPFRKFIGETQREGRIGILFKDDPGQHAFVERTALPLGWLQIASVLHFVRLCPRGTLVLLDEPELHLHPSLQRVMLELIAKERQDRALQIIIATHSSVLTNPTLTQRVGAKVWVAARGRCEQLDDARRVLDDLGVTSGDLVQANGIIWVEGPSDRLYIKKWIDLWATERNSEPPIERVHYSFALYGGALVKHLTLLDTNPEKVAIRAINRNFVLVIDRDLTDQRSGSPAPQKQRLIEEAEKIAQSDRIWMTDGYTIENYLPEEWAEYMEKTTDGRTRVRGSKVELAERFVQHTQLWFRSFRATSDLPTKIRTISQLIESWQTPQEQIEPPYLPPYLES